MPAVDQCEPSVIRALEKAGWVVTHQPFSLRVSKHEALYPDLRLQYGNNDQYIVVVEVKCFKTQDIVWTDFYSAVGQYLVYRQMLKINRIAAPLYLSLLIDVYEYFFDKQSIQETIKEVSLKIILIDLEREEIVRWIN